MLRVNRRSASARVRCCAWVHLIAKGIDPRCGVVDVQPGIQWRNVHAIAVHAHLNAVVQDGSKRRTGNHLGVRRRHPTEGAHFHPAAQRLQASEQIGVHLGNVMNHPAQLGDVVLFVDGLPFLHHLLQACEILNGVFIAPTGLSHQMLRVAPRCAAIQWSGPFADSAGAQHVVAKKRELVAETFLQLRQLRVGLILQEIHLKAHHGPALAMERQPRIVHAVLIEVREDLVGM